jgi:hypothetical protein
MIEKKPNHRFKLKTFCLQLKERKMNRAFAAAADIQTN